MADSWGARTLNYLMEQEGFRGEVYRDVNGHETIGYGHKVVEGEDWSAGITEEEGRRLLVQDFVKHNRLARNSVGAEAYDALGQREQAMLALSAWNPGWGSQPNLVEGILTGDREAQMREYEISANGEPLTRRNEAYRSLFFPESDEGVELEVTPEKTRVAERRPSTVRTFVDSEEFQTMTEDEQVAALAERDGRFAALLEAEPDRARRYAQAAAAAGRGEEGFTATMADALEGGLERGVGWSMLPLVGAIKLLEDHDLIDATDADDDLLDWANQRVTEGGLRIGTSWEQQVGGIVTSAGAAAVPAILATLAAIPVAKAAGLSGVPLLIATEGFGAGSTAFLAGYGESEGDLDVAAERGAVDSALGGFGGATSVLPRRLRMPLDFTAALAAGQAQGLDWDRNVVHALSLTFLAGIPGARPAPRIREALGMTPDAMPAAQRVAIESEREAAARAMSREALESVEGPFFSRDGVEYANAAEAMQAMGAARAAEPEVHVNPMDRSPALSERWARREELAAEDARPLDFLTDGTPDAEIPQGWNPGWRHVDQVPYGATPDRVTGAAGNKLKRPGEIIAPFARAFGFNVTRGNVANSSGSRGMLGWHWARNREMKVLRRDDLQTLAHEWGHDIVVVEPDLARYVQGRALAADVDRLRGWLQAEEARAGRTFTEEGVPSATLWQHRQNVPDSLRYIEELVAMSYDRPNLREGFSEFVRVYLTNNQRWGGETRMNDVAPNLTQIFERWIRDLPDAQRNALETFAEEAHAYVRQDATTALLARFGQDATPEMVMQSALSRFRQSFVDSNEGAWNAIARAASPEEADRAMAYLQAAQAAGRLTDLAAQRGVPRLVPDTDGNLVQRHGDGESLLDIIRDIGPEQEMMNAQGAYTTARRQRELYDQADLDGRHIHVPTYVDDLVAAARQREAEVSGMAVGGNARDRELLRLEASLPRRQFEDAVLAGVGARRRELTPLEEIEANLRIVDNERYAHLRGTHERLKAWQREIREYARAAGLLSERQIATMDRWNSEYVFPFKRDMSDVIGGAPSGGASSRGGIVRELRGSTRGFADDWTALTLEGADELFRRAEDNLAKRFVVDTIMDSPQAGLWFHMNEYLARSRSRPHEGLARLVGNVTPDAKHKITVWRDGDPFHYAPKDEGLLASMEFIHPPSYGAIDNLMKLANKTRRVSQDMTTLNPAFFVPAVPRDLVGGMIFSKTKGSIIGKAINGAWHAWRNSPQYQDYVAAVGSAANLTDVKPTTRASLLKDAKRADSRVQSLIVTPGDLVDTLRKITNTIEASTRMGEYLAATRQGVPAKHAAWLGTQVQPHFSARGTNMLFRGLVDTTRFLGATINSVDRLARGLFRDTEARGRLVARLGGLALASVTLEEINRRLVEDYHEIPPWLKQAYHIIPVPQLSDDGSMEIDLRLMPKNHEVGIIANVANRVMDELYADSRRGVASAAADVGALLLGGVGVNAAGDSFPFPAPVIVGEGAELYFNESFFTGNPIEAFEIANLSAYNRVEADTPQLYKDWGRVAEHAPWLPNFLESPAQAQHLIESFTSHFGSQAALLYDYTFNPNRVGLLPGEGPLERRFDLPEGKYSTVERDFYDTAAEMRTLLDDMRAFEDRREWDRLQAAYADPEKRQKLAKAKAYQIAREAVAAIDDAREAIRLNENLTPEERAEQDLDLKIKKRNILRQMNANWGRE